MRLSKIAAAVVVAALAAPAAAQAARFTVTAGEGACGGADTACGSVANAAGAAVAGDSIAVSPGTYNESATFGAPNVTITGSTTAPGVLITGSLTFSGNGATPSVLEKLVVAPATGPAVGVSGTAGVAVRDALLIGTADHGMTIANGAANSITRSTVVSGQADGSAVLVQPTTAATTLTLDSSILSGGANGAGLTVNTGVGQLIGSAGGATVTARYITVAGSAKGIVVDASAATGIVLLPTVGNIAATVSDSIVLGASSTKNYPGLLAIPPNTATLAFTRTDQTTAPDALFANAAKRNFRLRADAPAIDKAQVTAGDSATDIDGQPRASGAASDQGADEFVNTPPTAAFAIKTPAPRSGQPVQFDASGSTDREAGIGGEIVKYRWSFGDGTGAETTGPTTEHAYNGEGAVVVTLSVVDKQGAASAEVTAPLNVVDGTPPEVAIAKPKNNQKIKLSKTTTRTVTRNGKKTKRKTTTLTPISIAGTATDAAGVKGVVLTIEKLVAATTATKCTWLDPNKGPITKQCSKPILIRPALKSGTWSYNPLKKLKKGLSAGKYRVSAYGTDNSGAFGNSAPKNKVVTFTLTKK